MPDAAVLARIGDGAGDLGGVTLAHEAGDPGRLGITVEVRDEHVVRRIHAGQLDEVALGEPRLGAAESAPPRLLAEACEEGGDRRRVTVPQRAEHHAVDESRVHEASVAETRRAANRLDGPSCRNGPTGPSWAMGDRR